MNENYLIFIAPFNNELRPDDFSIPTARDFGYPHQIPLANKKIGRTDKNQVKKRLKLTKVNFFPKT
jgi:hypothetical protein